MSAAVVRIDSPPISTTMVRDCCPSSTVTGEVVSEFKPGDGSSDVSTEGVGGSGVAEEGEGSDDAPSDGDGSAGSVMGGVDSGASEGCGSCGVAGDEEPSEGDDDGDGTGELVSSDQAEDGTSNTKKTEKIRHPAARPSSRSMCGDAPTR